LVLDRTGDADAAIHQLEHALRLRPDQPEIYNNIGIVRGRIAPAAAVDDFRRALLLNPEYADAKINLAKLLASLGRHAEVVALLSSVVEHRREDSDLQMLLANSLAELGRFDDAIRHYEAAADAAPQAARPLVSLGNLYRRIGKFDEAHRCFVEAGKRDPRSCDALVGVLKHLKSSVPMDEAERIVRLADNPSMTIPERRQLHFAVSAYKEAIGDYDGAFSHMDQGNRLRRLEVEPQNGPYSFARHIDRIDRIIETFNEGYFRRVAGFGSSSELPVFVVGMPRSGTTLCEQILASHSRVWGAGELPDIRQIERELRSRYDVQGAGSDSVGYAAHLTPDIVRSAAEGQLRRLQGLAPEASRIVDKMPMNYQRLGLIATLFPKAKIVHCRRDPMDTGLSCYSKDFVNFPLWASDLASIGQVYRLHDRLMTHWRRVVPIEIFEFRYEDVVRDFEKRARALIEFCGLAWEDACLEFHRTDRQVKTASLEQVRQPIYDTSIGRWRRFRRHLTPLQEALKGV
jgi:tetratricopeptide (TPR) repeat protein